MISTVKRINSIFIPAIIMVLLAVSCDKKQNHKITWHYWTDAANTRALAFTPDGRYYDLYDYSNTWNNRYDIGEKIINLKNFTHSTKDSADAEILYLQDGKLVLKYKDNRIDSLHSALDKDLIMGNWYPFGNDVPADTFILGKATYDCMLKDNNGTHRPFRYYIISTDKALFDYYMENRKDTVSYTLSKDKLMLMLQAKNITTTLKRN